MSKPRLISFKVCPFVQRSVILLKEKKVDYDIEFIDVYNPPEWFTKLSPTGKVPVMEVDDTVLFESSIISEYIDEVYGESLHPDSPLKKAQNRAWIEFTSSLYMGTFNLMMAKTKEDADSAITTMKKDLSLLADNKKNDPWFNGNKFSLVDIAASPFFIRAAFYKKYFDVDLLNDFQKLQKWSDALIKRETIMDSIVDGFDEMLLSRMASNESYLKPTT